LKASLTRSALIVCSASIQNTPIPALLMELGPLPDFQKEGILFPNQASEAMGYLKKMMRSQGMHTTKKKHSNGEKQCPDCQTYKKADNCIRCFRLERARRYGVEVQLAEHTRVMVEQTRLIQDLREIAETTSFMRLQEKIKERINRPMAPAARPRAEGAEQ